METKKIIIDGEEIEVAIKLPKEYYETNNINDNLEDTLQYDLDELNGEDNE